jgi:hypothetical protein
MALRSRLPDIFYVDGHILTLPIEADETISQWLERVRCVIKELYDYNGVWTPRRVATAKKEGRLHLRRVLHGAEF